VAGIGFAVLGGALLASLRPGWVPAWLAFTGAAACIQLRLLCNMLDGLVAVEGGVKGKAGDLFNELPDRVEDSVLLVGAGWAAGNVQLGWLCAALALLTAYIRALGASLGQPQDFSGPGAKPQRMFLLTAGCLAALVYPAALAWALWLTASATLLTAARRSVRLYRRLP
jgi:phosphatidylglycerophosphate synthase